MKKYQQGVILNKELQKAIELSGNQNTLAKELGVTRQCVSKWVYYGVPIERGVMLEKHFNGKVKMEKLCADKLKNI